MRKNRVIEQNRCYHLVSRLAHRAFFLDDEEKDRAVALMRRVEAGVKASMSYCINRTVSISSDPFDLALVILRAGRKVGPVRAEFSANGLSSAVADLVAK